MGKLSVTVQHNLLPGLWTIPLPDSVLVIYPPFTAEM